MFCLIATLVAFYVESYDLTPHALHAARVLHAHARFCFA